MRIVSSTSVQAMVTPARAMAHLLLRKTAIKTSAHRRNIENIMGTRLAADSSRYGYSLG